MATHEFYLQQGGTPTYRTSVISGLGTVSVWTPTTSTRVVLTELSIGNIGAASTIAFYFGDLAGTKIMEYNVNASAMIFPSIGAIETTMYDRSIFAKVGTASATDGFRINLFGFELP